MAAHAIKLKVTAGVPKDCIFQLEGDGWNGVCEELWVTVRDTSFEDAKRKMEAALRAQIERASIGIPGQGERGLPEGSGCWQGTS